jgi:hypothetical protein
MKELVVLTPRGCLGAGPFREDVFLNGMRRNPQVIATDMGSLDPGPYFLGAGLPHQARFQTKNELSFILPLAKENNIPFIIGTAGGSGGERHIQWTLDVIKEVVKEKKLTFKMAVISSTVDKDFLKRKIDKQRVRGLGHDKDLTSEDIDKCTEIVAQIGFEPFVEALNRGAELIVGGRACDNTMVASVPIKEGFDKGLALHMGKLMECGGLVAVPPRSYSSVIGTIREDHLLIEPADPEMKCTITSVASHEMYERSDPYTQKGPGCIVNMTNVKFEQQDPRTVKISGSKYVPDLPYRVKLEGAEKVGYRAIVIEGVRDPIMISQIDDILARAKQTVAEGLKKNHLRLGIDYHLIFRVYGKNGVMGSMEPVKNSVPHEIGLIVEVVAPTQDLAEDICHYTNSGCLMFADYEGKLATAGNLARPYSPSAMRVGEVYRLRVHHLLEIDDPLMFPITMMEVGA